jgi:hypothetical protein
MLFLLTQFGTLVYLLDGIQLHIYLIKALNYKTLKYKVNEEDNITIGSKEHFYFFIRTYK